jgi:hypothetical protein
MYNITLFCTQHGENGNCNVHELYGIIETLNPEIIFEEIPPCNFDEYYKNMTRSNLETDTIKMYLEKHPIKHIPVDHDVIMPQSFWDDNRYMFEKIETTNYEFRKSLDLDSQYVKLYGFNYLNSINCINTRNDYYGEIEVTLQILNNEKLFKIYKLWNNINEKRENEMINNIYSYCKENSFDKGLFFIGAAHRESIIKKIKNCNETEEINLNWNYIEYDNNGVQGVLHIARLSN